MMDFLAVLFAPFALPGWLLLVIGALALVGAVACAREAFRRRREVAAEVF